MYTMAINAITLSIEMNEKLKCFPQIQIRFPDLDVATASNFCRNPDGREGGPWCYTDTSSGPEWEFCHIPFCDGKEFHFWCVLCI